MADNNEKAIDRTSQNDEYSPEASVSFSVLAQGRSEITIEHDGQQYRLRATKNGKLLLNK
jgi:hemin uptake protein HemP